MSLAAMQGMAANDRPFSLTRGGPFHHVLTRCHLVDGHGRIRWLSLALATWLPVILLSGVQWLLRGRVDPLVLDPTMHVRLLVAMPLLIVAERVLDVRSALAVEHVRDEGIAERATLAAILERTERLRDSRIVEGALAAVVLLLGQAELWRVHGFSGFINGRVFTVRPSLAMIWCLTLALPLVQFLVLRWLWRWAIWTYVLVRLSQLPLSLNSLHPDRAAGLQPLAFPVDGFALFNAAVASILAAAWLTEILGHRATLQHLSPSFSTVFVIATIVAIGPLLLFSSQLYRARNREADEYHALARTYVDDFRGRWLAEHPDEPVLGNRDIRALNDLGGSYERADSTRLYPFDVRTVLQLWVGALAPMVPLVLSTTPISDVTQHMGHLLFGVGG